MAHLSPLRQRHEDAGAATLLFADPDRPDHGAPVVDTFGSIEAEYAAIRKGAALLDLPQRGAVRVTGGERLEFLNRMLTQELMPDGSPLPAFRNADSFWLNRKGRIDADLRLTQLLDIDATADDPGVLGRGGMLFDLDILAAPGVVSSLTDFVFTEDIELEDVSERTHRFAVHGPAAARLLADNSSPHTAFNEAPPVAELAAGQSTVVRIAGHTVLVDRDDQTGEIGLHLLCDVDHAAEVFDQLAQHARDDFGHHNDPATDAYKLRHAGWAAFNVARIEAGRPLFRVDFSTTNLPNETGLLEQRVSFTKGCYLGQEVVARMQSLGHPKQTLNAVRFASPDDIDGVDITEPNTTQDHLPQAGAPIFPPRDDPDTPPRLDEGVNIKPVGAVTSITQSPMLGGEHIGFAQLKWGHESPGARLWSQAPAGLVKTTVNHTRHFWSRD